MMDKKKKIFIICGALCALLAILFLYEVYIPHPATTASKKIEIANGLGSRKIAELLKKEGTIRSRWIFVTYVSLTGRASSLKPGAYTFQNNSIFQIARALIRGGANERTVTIPEGWTAQNIADYLDEQGIISHNTFLTDVKTGSLYKKQFDFLNDTPVASGLEGYLFPDTYKVFTPSPAEDIIGKMLANFDKKLTPELRAEITRQKKTIFQIITMASLIEKEVARDTDRSIVSGILWKRLKLGMPLQVDATITYIKNQKSKIKKEGNGKIFIEDIKIESPYNTYKYPGLPKAPIGNPGISAIRAALYPKESPYLYYLSAPNGRTIFSQTLEEHNIAKTKYLY